MAVGIWEKEKRDAKDKTTGVAKIALYTVTEVSLKRNPLTSLAERFSAMNNHVITVVLVQIVFYPVVFYACDP